MSVTCTFITHVPVQLVRQCVIKLQTEKETVIQPVRAWSLVKLPAEKETVMQSVKACAAN